MKRIAISGLNNIDNPQPGIPVAKSLKPNKNYKLIGLSYDVNEPGIYQNLFEEVFLIPYPNMDKEIIFNKLKEINPDIIIPTLDAELPFYIKHKKELEERLGIKVLVPEEKSFELRDKKNLETLINNINNKILKTPKTFNVSSIMEISQKIQKKEINFPFYIKGNYYKAYKVSNMEEVIKKFTEIVNEWGFPVLIQETITGEEINYIGIAKNGEVISGMGMKKLTTTELGKVWNAITIKNNTLLEITKILIKNLKWDGPFEIEAISNGKEIYLIEINPRFPAWTYFSTLNNINLPQILIDILNNNDTNIEKKYEGIENKMYVRYVEELITDFSKFKNILLKKSLGNE